MTEEEKEAIEYLKVRLYGNEECKYIEVAQEDLRIFLELVTREEKGLERWKKYCDEQEENIIEKNNKICDLEFKIENQQAELEKKDKIIDEMAEFIWTYDCCDHFPDNRIKCKMKGKNCINNCIKQYFQKKAREENE